MATQPEGTASWEAVLRAQGVSEEMITEARRAAAVMVRAAEVVSPDPRAPLAPDAFAHQLASMARARARFPA